MALLHRCPGCGALIPYGAARCEGCARAVEASRVERAKARERERRRLRREEDDPKYRAFYRSKEWRALSASVLSRAGFRCEDCGGVACEVHHEPGIRTPEGWAHRLDAANLHPLCTRCHNKRHGRFCRNQGVPEKV